MLQIALISRDRTLWLHTRFFKRVLENRTSTSCKTTDAARPENQELPLHVYAEAIKVIQCQCKSLIYNGRVVPCRKTYSSTGIGFSMFRICWIVVKEVDYFVSVIFAIMLQKWENEAYFVWKQDNSELFTK